MLGPGEGLKPASPRLEPVPDDPLPSDADVAAALPDADPLGEADAAVLVPLYRGPRRVLLTRRREDLSSHPGQVSFPGGRVEPGDASTVETALREAREEVGIDPDAVTVLGRVTDFETYGGNHVVAYAGGVDGAPPKRPAAGDEEVAEVLVVALDRLLEASAYEARVHASERDRAVHYWHLDEATVWGITGYILARFLEQAAGWTPPTEPRVVDDETGFQP